MATDIILYLVVAVATLGLGLLGFLDRGLTILGSLIGFLGGLYIANTGQIFTAQVYNTTTSAWVQSIIPQNEFSILLIILGIFVVIDVFILIRLS